MSGKNKAVKKHKFSKKEKQIIKEMREKLSQMGIPRDQWSMHIQNELANRKRGKSLDNLLNPYAKEDSGIISRLKSKIGNVFKRILSRRLSGQLDMPEEQIKELMEIFSGARDHALHDSIDPLGAFFPKLDKPDDEKLGKQGTFVVNRPDKKEMIIEFDDEE